MAVRKKVASRRPSGVAAPKAAPKVRPPEGVEPEPEETEVETIAMEVAKNRPLRIKPPTKTIVFRVGPIPHYDRGTNYYANDLVHKTVVDGVLRRVPKTWTIPQIDGKKISPELPVRLTLMDEAWCEVYNNPVRPGRVERPVDRGFYEN